MRSLTGSPRWILIPRLIAGIASGAMDANAWLIDLSERSATRFFDTPFAQLTVPEQVFVAVWTLEADVNNGGFDQYYLNSSGDNAWYAPAALRAIGAEQTAAIAQRANAAFGPDGPPPDRDARLAAMDKLEEVDELWDDCDQAFYAYPHDLTALLSAYVQSHKSEIQGAA
jgi:uncharacterized protein DUF4375